MIVQQAKTPHLINDSNNNATSICINNETPLSKPPEAPNKHLSASGKGTAPRISTNPFSDNYNPFIPEAFRHPNKFFSTDLDPFSSSSSVSASPVLKNHSNNNSFNENHSPKIDNKAEILLNTAHIMDAIESEDEVMPLETDSVEAKIEKAEEKKIENKHRKSISESSEDEDDKIVAEKTADDSSEAKERKDTSDVVSVNVEPLYLSNNDEGKLELDDDRDKSDDDMNMDEYFKGTEKIERKAHADSDEEGEKKETKGDSMERFNKQLFNEFDNALKSVNELEVDNDNDDDDKNSSDESRAEAKVEEKLDEIKGEIELKKELADEEDDGRLRFADGDAEAKVSRIEPTENQETTQDGSNSFTNTVRTPKITW